MGDSSTAPDESVIVAVPGLTASPIVDVVNVKRVASGRSMQKEQKQWQITY